MQASTDGNRMWLAQTNLQRASYFVCMLDEAHILGFW